MVLSALKQPEPVAGTAASGLGAATLLVRCETTHLLQVRVMFTKWYCNHLKRALGLKLFSVHSWDIFCIQINLSTDSHLKIVINVYFLMDTVVKFTAFFLLTAPHISYWIKMAFGDLLYVSGFYLCKRSLCL